MTKRKSTQHLPARQKKAKQIAPQEALHLKSNLSGSVSDDFTETLFKQATLTVPKIMRSDPETFKKRQKAILAAMTGINPQDEIEGMLAAQMIALHNASMECFSYSMAIGSSVPAVKGEFLNQANKLCRTYAGAMESLTRYRNKDTLQQKLVVERVHVHDGGKAIVGNMASPNLGRQNNE